jgi:hypothetical protein
MGNKDPGRHEDEILTPKMEEDKIALIGLLRKRSDRQC